MEWTSDVTVGEWVRKRVDDPSRGTMHDLVPRGFASYTRVFHPASKSRPIGRAWPPVPHERHWKEWEEFSARAPEIETAPARWSDAAAAFGTTMHGAAQWGRLVRVDQQEWDPNAWQQVLAPDGWEFHAPSGQLEPQVLAAIASIGAAHTSTPDEGQLALWEGWGGIVGGMGWGPSRGFLTFEERDDEAGERVPAGTAPTPVRDGMQDPPTWQRGILSDEISRGARFGLPDRNYVLFRCGASELADPLWVLDAPWRDREAEHHGWPPSAEAPSLLWPADRAWVMAGDTDWDSTIIAGSAELQHGLCSDPRLEALAVRENASIRWGSDDLNRPR